jgi:hypothetical protein
MKTLVTPPVEIPNWLAVFKKSPVSESPEKLCAGINAVPLGDRICPPLTTVRFPVTPKVPMEMEFANFAEVTDASANEFVVILVVAIDVICYYCIIHKFIIFYKT